MPVSLSIRKVHTFTGHAGSVYALEKSENPGLFFSGSSDKIVSEWNLDLVTPPKGIVNVGSIIYALHFLPWKNQLLIGVSGGGFHVVDMKERREIRNIQHHSAGIFDIVSSQELNRMYTASGDGTLAVWSLDDFSLLHSVRICKEKVRSLALRPDHRELALAAGDGTVRLFDPVTMEEKIRFAAHELSANCVSYHPRESLLLSGGRDAHLKIWDYKSGTLVESIPGHNYAIYSISFSPDASLFATGSRDKTVKIWDAETFDFLVRIDKEKFQGHLNSVNKVLWTPHKNYLLSTGDDRSIMVWDVTKT